MKLKIAAKIDRVDREYFAAEIEPLLAQSHVEFLGEIAEHQKSEFLGNAEEGFQAATELGRVSSGTGRSRS